jgi:putative membrane protein (TIGR04086 family)
MKTKVISKKTMSAGSKTTFYDILRGVLIAVIASLVGVLLLALIAKISGMSESVILPLNQVIKIASILVGCFFGLKDRTKGVFKGAVIGICYAVISIFIFLIVNRTLNGNSFSVIDLLANTAAGAVSGIITVNFRKR